MKKLLELQNVSNFIKTVRFMGGFGVRWKGEGLKLILGIAYSNQKNMFMAFSESQIT
jgi:hypothetical protein